ncbi:MAG TPA: lipoyl(octanoyl) transferase LipB [Gammaproteobacteria bacterium]|nr:lipoyl(octanoyl) transferase LipB [Gammaproteobacteria bacterium]
MARDEGKLVIRLRRLGVQAYGSVWRAMRGFTAERREDTPDELWLVQHPPVFTMGLNAKAEHLLAPGAIPVVNVDRGGQVTYHGPGQIVLYPLLDLNRLRIGVRELVRAMEQAVIDLLAARGIAAEGRTDAPGVYVGEAKIAALGLRVKRGRSYHGLALNVDLDLEPFSRINPCGYAGMPVTRTRDLGIADGPDALGEALAGHLLDILGYNSRLPADDELPHVQPESA